MPVLLFGNAFAGAIAVYLNWQAVIASHAYLALLVGLLLLVPMARSYLRLRKRPRPEFVSRRRVRVIIIYSFLMGLAWSVTVIMLFPYVDSVNGTIVLLMMFFLCYGSVALTPSIPWAAVAYILPILLASFISGITNGIVAADALSLLYLAGSLAILKTVAQNWQDASTNVRISLERVAAESELHRREAEEAQAVRAMIEAIPFALVVTRGSKVVEATEQASRQFGVSRDQFAEVDIGDLFVDPLDQDRLIETQNSHGGVDDFEIQFKDINGKPFWAVLSNRPLLYQGEDCRLNAIFVIDDRKRAENRPWPKKKPTCA